MTIALLTKSFSLRDLLNEQASGRGVLRLVSDASLATDRGLAKAGLRLFCPDATNEQALADLRRTAPRARTYTRATYLGERKKFVQSLRLDAFSLRSDLIDLLLVVVCEMRDSGHPVYLVVDDEKIPAMLALGALLNDLFDLVCDQLKQDAIEHAAVLLVPVSSCTQALAREAAI